MPTPADVITNYQTLCRFCDGLWLKVQARHAQQLSCRQGCADCCRLETVCALEAHLIASRLAAADGSLPEPDPDGGCVFLANQACQIYPVRPIICRTHGLPLRSAALTANHTDCCPLNFTSLDPAELAPELVLDLDRITDNLMRLNLAFCLLLGQPDLAEQRFALADIRSGRLPASLT